MLKYELICSTDGAYIDYAQPIDEATAGDFWQCNDIAAAHGCDFWHVSEYEE